MFKEFQKRLNIFSDSVYYEPMSEEEIIDFEKKIGKRLNSVYREFLSTFGLIHDIFKSIDISEESILEDVDYLRDKLPGYFPIFIDVDEVDTIYLMSMTDPDSEEIYKVVDENNHLGEIQPYKTLTELLSLSIHEIEYGEDERCLNTKKINCFEYTFESKYFNDFIEMFKASGLEQLSDWHPKYYPDNIFGDELAEFTFNGISFNIEVDEDKTEYRFEFDEPILTKKEDSIAKQVDELFNVQKIKYKKEVVKLIAT